MGDNRAALTSRAEPDKAKGGRPRLPNRAALTGIIFVLKTGLPWECLPPEMGIVPVLRHATVWDGSILMDMLKSEGNGRYVLLYGGMIGLTSSLNQILSLGWEVLGLIVMIICIVVTALGVVYARDALGRGLLGGSFVSAASLLFQILLGRSPLDLSRTMLLLLIMFVGISGYMMMRKESVRGQDRGE